MKKILFSAAVAALALVSCQKEVSVQNDLAPMNEIALKSANSSTKSAINGTTFPAGYDMLVSAYRNLDTDHKGDNTDAASDYFEGIPFTQDATDNTVWSGKTSKYWPLSGTLDFLAVASAGLKSGTTGIIPTCVWGESSNVAKKVVVTVPDNSVMFDDLLYGAANAQSYASGGTAITFNHAMSAVVFTAHSNVAYDADKNIGITIDTIVVCGAKYSGTLTVSNAQAGGNTSGAALSAAWSGLESSKDYIEARVWDSGNTGIKTDESKLTALNLTATSKTVGTSAPFGEGYVLLPGQSAVPFIVFYTIHNGFKADGTTKLDNSNCQYKYTPTGTWDMGKKHIYDITITLNEVTVKPTVTDWDNQTVVNVPDAPVAG